MTTEPFLLPLKVINLYAAPGVGKSTTAAGLFNLMKLLGYSVELVTEFAKDLTYEGHGMALNNQLRILAEQDWRLRRLVGQTDWVITDSPLPLGLAYMNPEYEGWLEDAVWGAHDRYQNFHVLLLRAEGAKYDARGRNQTEAEAMRLDTVIGNIFEEACDEEDGYAMSVRIGDSNAPYHILEQLVEGEPADE